MSAERRLTVKIRPPKGILKNDELLGGKHYEKQHDHPLEKETEHRAVEYLIREAFWNVYRPGCYEHYVMHVLREDKAFVPERNFVMELDGEIVGQTMFMHADIRADDGRDIPIMTMGHICIAPEYATPEGHFVDEAAVEEFDQEFPAKVKLKLPGQLF